MSDHDQPRLDRPPTVISERAQLDALIAARDAMRADAAARGVTVNKARLPEPEPEPEPLPLPAVVATRSMTCTDDYCILVGVVTINECCRACRAPTAPVVYRPPGV